MRTLLFLTLALASAAVQAGDWPQFRGPAFNGSAEEKNLPVKFSPTEGVAWAADLPGPSAATPIVSGDRVFVSSTDKKQETLVALCFDRKSGRELWRQTVGKGVKQDTRSNFSAPSPAADGKTVVFFYGNGDLAAFDYAGQALWSKNIGPFAFLWTFSTSPVIYDGTLLLQVLQRNTPVSGRGVGNNIESYLLALEPASGKELWRHVRPAKAVSESLEAFTTPMPFEHKGRKEVILAGGDALTGHDPKTGAELWRWETWNPGKIPHWRLVPSPVAGGGVVLLCAPKGDPVYAIKAGGSGTLAAEAVAWVSREQKEVTSDVPTPVYYDGDFFILSDLRKTLTRVDPATGKAKWTIQTPGRVKYEASPLAADGKLYLVNFDGLVTVIDAASGQELHSVAMDENREDVCRSGVIAAHGQLFVRTTKKLYCIAK